MYLYFSIACVEVCQAVGIELGTSRNHCCPHEAFILEGYITNDMYRHAVTIVIHDRGV